MSEDHLSERVRHVVSGKLGTRLSRGIWYSSVKFDGENGISWVASESLEEQQ